MMWLLVLVILIPVGIHYGKLIRFFYEFVKSEKSKERYKREQGIN